MQLHVSGANYTVNQRRRHERYLVFKPPRAGLDENLVQLSIDLVGLGREVIQRLRFGQATLLRCLMCAEAISAGRPAHRTCAGAPAGLRPAMATRRVPISVWPGGGKNFGPRFGRCYCAVIINTLQSLPAWRYPPNARTIYHHGLTSWSKKAS